MKIRIVSHKPEIDDFDCHTEIVHLAFRPSNTDVLKLLQKCDNLKALHIPASYTRTLSQSNRMLMEMKNVQLLEGDVWGHRKDINEYYEIKPGIIEEIALLRKTGTEVPAIVKVLSKTTKLSPELIEYIAQGIKGKKAE